MKTIVMSALIAVLMLSDRLSAEVTITERDDCCACRSTGRKPPVRGTKTSSFRFLYPVIGPNGESTNTLRHRFVFHHGDSQTAKVAEQYRDYTSDRDATVLRMRALTQDRKWKEIVEQFARDDFSSWPAEFAGQASEAHFQRGQAHAFLKNGKAAEVDLLAATKLNAKNELAWMTLGDNYVTNLNDESHALAAYRESLAITGPTQGWQPLTTTLAIVRMLTDQVKTDEALAMLRPYDELKSVAQSTASVCAYGHVYAAQGRERRVACEVPRAAATGVATMRHHLIVWLIVIR